MLDTKITGKYVKTLYRNGVAGECIKECSVTAVVEVECDKGKRDPSFAPSFLSDIRLNENVLRGGEGMIVYVKAESDMFITVFQYLPHLPDDEKVYRVFPNKMQSGGYLKQSESLMIPDDKLVQRYRLVADLPKGKERVVEELMVVATRTNIPFPEKMELATFQRILSEIPLNERREAMLPYEIVRSRK